MRPFVPEMFGCQNEYEPYTITLENLLYGKENASFVDIKLGTSTVTLDAQRRGTLVVKAREFTDWYGRTSYEYGFTLAGICLKDPVTG